MRRRILDAALGCYEGKGAAATTVDDICAGAGLSVGSIYHHFAGKIHIFEQLVREAMADYLVCAVDALERGSGLEDSLGRLVRFHVSWVEKRPTEARLMLRSGEAAPGRISGRQGYQKFSEAISPWLRREARAGRIRRMEPDLYSVLLMGPLMEHARQRSRGLTTASGKTIERDLIEGLLRLLTSGDEEPRIPHIAIPCSESSLQWLR